jgi:hypothetical protein
MNDSPIKSEGPAIAGRETDASGVDAAALSRLMAAERQRSRRSLFWAGSLILFVMLLGLTLFIAVGIFVLRSARQTYEVAFQAEGKTTSFASDIIGVGARVDKIEGAQLDVQDAMDQGALKLTRETEGLHSEIARLREMFEDRRQTEGDAMARLGTDIRDLRAADEDRAREQEAVWEELAALADRVERAAAAPPAAAAIRGAATPAQATSESGAPAAGTADQASAAGGEQTEEGLATTGSPARPREISVVTFPGGDRYEGEMRDGLFSGVGVLSSVNGDRYEGAFRDDMKEGKGTLKFANGDRYTGEFHNDMMHGRGSMVYQNKGRYVGEFRNGRRHGVGTLTFPNGDRYEGAFDEDNRTGQGTYYFAEGSKYVGEFLNGKRHGKGRYEYVGGGEYVGEFRDGRKHGLGECVYPGGERVKGYWTDDKFERAAE